MKWTLAVVVAALVFGGAALAQQAPAGDAQQELRMRIEERFDVVPLTDGLALRPKTVMRDVRLIEIADDGTVAINGDPVTGREIRERLGGEADAVLRLSQMSAEARSGLFASRQPPAAAQEPLEPVERPERTSPPPQPRPEPAPERRAPERTRRSTGDRVQVFGDARVAANEHVTGQVVAVIGSVRVDGEVGDQVVAVLGSVDLGPNAVVRGDVVSVGGRVRRAEGAEIRGSVTEVALSNVAVPVNVDWPGVWWGPRYGMGFGGVPRLIGSLFRLMLLMLFAGLAFVIARPTVEAAAARVADNPVQATFVGLAVEILLLPTLLLTSLILVITVIGIPLLLLMPFLILFLLLLAVVGFAGVAGALGAWFRNRTGTAIPDGFAAIAVGVVVILLPLLVGRLLGMGGWGVTPIAFLFVAAGIAFEFLVWTAGFGAVLTNAFSRWQARRATRVPAAPPPAA